jgi:hypothetical protein
MKQSRRLDLVEGALKVKYYSERRPSLILPIELLQVEP